MANITLVLPFALPPPELATDLIRALDAPALAGLLSRARMEQFDADHSLRNLPHEAWLARTLGLSASGHSAFAGAAMRGLGLDPGQDSWFIINPAHVEIARTHLSMWDMRLLRLSNVHAKGLFDTAKPVFDDAGKTLVYGDAHTWFMRAGEWAGLQTTSPDSAIGLNLTDLLPVGDAASEFRRLQNEVQMLWFEHPANTEREARGLAAVNSFWLWGLADNQARVPASPLLAVSAAPPWLAALENCAAADLPNPFGGDAQSSMLIRCDLSEAAISTDWAAWLSGMQRFEEALFAPALAALRGGGGTGFSLVLSNLSAVRQFTTSKWAQRAFWRGASLEPLLP